MTQIQVRVDEEEQSLFSLERKYDKENNQRSVEVIESQHGLTELLLVNIEGNVDQCPILNIIATIKNQGTLPISNYTLSLCASHPTLGAPRFDRLMINTPLDPNQEVILMLNSPDFPRRRLIQPFAILDADNRINECDEFNNQKQFPIAYQCGKVDGY